MRSQTFEKSMRKEITVRVYFLRWNTMGHLNIMFSNNIDYEFEYAPYGCILPIDKSDAWDLYLTDLQKLIDKNIDTIYKYHFIHHVDIYNNIILYCYVLVDYNSMYSIEDKYKSNVSIICLQCYTDDKYMNSIMKKNCESLTDVFAEFADK